MKKSVLSCFLGICLAGMAARAWAQETPDTPENRAAAARHYLKTVPAEDFFQDIVSGMSKNLPQESRERFLEFIKQNLRWQDLERITMANVTKHFTVNEIDALTAFYGSPEGRSIQKKFPAYMTDVINLMQKEITRAIEAIQPRPN